MVAVTTSTLESLPTEKPPGWGWSLPLGTSSCMVVVGVAGQRCRVLGRPCVPVPGRFEMG